ncbi:hypothetical protein Q5752_006133 [Cryptotrichosporon argae]
MRLSPVLGLAALAIIKPAAAAAVNATANATAAVGPAATLAGGAVVTGYTMPGLYQDIWAGIPFAAAPTGALRFAPPQAATYNASFAATQSGPACLQNGSDTSMAGAYGMSEDCLTLNVFAPEGASAAGAALPVMVWIFGGGFEDGTVSIYNGSGIVGRSIEMNTPVIYVAANYRLGIFGWGEGAEMAANGATNLGLRDQLFALEWVRDNIAAFGGDPSKVTAFGESAGAISISLMLLNESIDLFRGAIMESGAQSTNPLGPANTTWQTPYDLTVAYAGCNATANGTAAGNQSTFDCLKALPADVLNNATLAVKSLPQYQAPFIWGPSIDGDLIPGDPWELVTAGAYAKLPFITGNNLDEGTLFISTATNSTEFIAAYMETVDFSPSFNLSVLETLLAAYPNDPTIGSPYGTGNETFGLSPYFKELASIVGDGQFQSRRRKFLRDANYGGFNNTWTYQFEGATPGLAAYYGVMHGTDVYYVFGEATTANGYTADEEALATAMQTYWINFANYLDPNGSGGNTTAATLTYWPPHAYPANKNMLQLASGNVSVIQDDYRESQMDVFGRFHDALAY